MNKMENEYIQLPPFLTSDQKQLLSDWDAMDDHQKELVKAYIQGIIRK